MSVLSYGILNMMPRILTRECNICGKVYTGQGTKFCSQECYHKSTIGHKYNVGRPPWNKGKILPELAKQRTGKGNPAWRGGVTYRQGYKFMKMPEHPNRNRGGYVAEHRLIVEKKIGRYLHRHEQVHHLDFDKTNNHPDNLIILTRSEHLKLHRNNQTEKYKHANSHR